MKDIRAVTRREEAEKLARSVRDGQLSLLAEVDNGKMKYFIKSKSGTILAVISDRYSGFFGDLVAEIGNGDGLFPGFSQTA